MNNSRLAYTKIEKETVLDKKYIVDKRDMEVHLGAVFFSLFFFLFFTSRMYFSSLSCERTSFDDCHDKTFLFTAPP